MTLQYMYVSEKVKWYLYFIERSLANPVMSFCYVFVLYIFNQME